MSAWLVDFLKGRGLEVAFVNSSMDSIWLIASLIASTSSSSLESAQEHLQGIPCNIMNISKSFSSFRTQEWVVHDNHAADFSISTINKSYNFCSHLAQ